jgi:hypothetical protein
MRVVGWSRRAEPVREARGSDGKPEYPSREGDFLNSRPNFFVSRSNRMTASRQEATFLLMNARCGYARGWACFRRARGL